MDLAEVDQVERVGTAREARRHRVIVVFEANAPLRAARATHLEVVKLGHEHDGNATLRRVTARYFVGVASCYHGGVTGLTLGDLVLPPDETGSGSLHEETTEQYGEDRNPHRSDRVYVTTHIDVAWFYAVFGGARDREAGAVYRVDPHGSVERDRDERDAFACARATVVSIPYAEIRVTTKNQRIAWEIFERFKARG